MSETNKNTEYSLQGDDLYIAPQQQLNLKELPVQNWILSTHPKTGETFLRKQKSFKMPEKIYGDVNTLTDRVFKTFDATDKNLGVLMSGTKGTGKTVQMKYMASNSGKPVIIIDRPYSGQAIMGFLDRLGGSCVIVFDEFEKTYRTVEEQESILPLLDGISSSTHIFLFTTNVGVSHYFIDRPSRIRYNVHYEGLSDEIIREIVKDKLIHKHLMEDIINSISLIQDKTIDVICSLIEEVNIHEEVPAEFLGIFNLSDPTDQDFELVTNIKVPFATTGIEPSEVQVAVKEWLETKVTPEEIEMAVKVSGSEDADLQRDKIVSARYRKMTNIEANLTDAAIQDLWTGFTEEKPEFVTFEDIELSSRGQNVKNIVDSSVHDKEWEMYVKTPYFFSEELKQRLLMPVTDMSTYVQYSFDGFSIKKSGKDLYIEFGGENPTRFLAKPPYSSNHVVTKVF